jgi:hypothetical protein
VEWTQVELTGCHFRPTNNSPPQANSKAEAKKANKQASDDLKEASS